MAWGSGGGGLGGGSFLDISFFLFFIFFLFLKKKKKEIGRETYHAVVGAALASEVETVVVENAFVDDTVGEHGLGSDAEDEDSEGEVFSGFGVGPHI